MVWTTLKNPKNIFMEELVKKETCKKIAMVVNSILKKEYRYEELTKVLKQNSCPYVVFTMNYLTNKHGVFIAGKKTITIPKEPIHYMLIFSHIQNKLAEAKKINETEIIRPASISIPNLNVKTLISFTDKELADELRNRGFEITAKKTIEL